MARELGNEAAEATLNEIILNSKLAEFTVLFRQILLSVAKIDQDLDPLAHDLISTISIGSTVEQNQSILSAPLLPSQDYVKSTQQTVATIFVDSANRIFSKNAWTWENF